MDEPRARHDDGAVGQQLRAHATWWEQGRAWLKYVARCQFLLQQGRFTADVAAFYGESAPVQTPALNPALPAGYDYDAVNADVLLKQARVENGQLVLASGMRYRVLLLAQSQRTMTPKLLRQLRDFAAAGLTIVGAPPESSPSLNDFPKCDAELKTLVAELWGNCDGTTVTEHALGQGKAVWGQPLEQVFAGLNTKPDFAFATNNSAELRYIHRVAGDAEIYFVSNQRDKFDTVACTFRVAGRTPELWHPDTGVMETAPVFTDKDGRISVPLQFDPAGSVFVVFRKPAAADHAVAAKFTPVENKSATAAAGGLKIIKAEYGSFEANSDQAADVTAIVKKMVAAGQRRIPARNEPLGGDPAGSVTKELRIDYSLAGKKQSRTVDENQTLELPAGAEVLRATYGLLDEKPVKTMDLTAKLAGLIQDNKLTVTAGNTLAGRDPAPMTLKQLRVEYVSGGSKRTAEAGENQVLKLPAENARPQAPSACELSVANGQTVARVWQPGTIELTTAAGKTVKAEVSAVPALVELTGEWELNFPPNWGAPAAVTLPKLISWPEHADKGVKYFSGTATYAKEMEIPADRLGAGCSLWLNLGTVKNLAEVSLNGKPLGILWKPPFRVDVTGAARPGKNRLEIKITNLWPNRLIGDEQLAEDREWGSNLALKSWPQWVVDGKPSPTGRYTFTTWHHWKKDDALVPSGLLGPVTLQTAVQTAVR
ncbi:MAG: glycosyl hydrolase [Verrucomicrobia bacterium]|nr:glycosyl hydrolase [Verrucomicrobiota bacterium]